MELASKRTISFSRPNCHAIRLEVEEKGTYVSASPQQVAAVAEWYWYRNVACFVMDENTIVITAEIESGFASLKTTWFHSAAVQFPRAWHHSKRRHRWVGVKSNTRNGHCDHKCPSAKHLRMVLEDTGASSEGATSAWMAADEEVCCTHAFLTMLQPSRRLVCQGRLEPGLRVNVISRIHWSQNLHTTQPERPN
ncbi:uncharacterized protein TNCV_3658001 [Trichonephila clavipes]|nr:uncharacterized protein TNCV_3658001 [Trichonephila clavipes]